MDDNYLMKPNKVSKNVLKDLKKQGIKNIELEVQSANNYILKHSGLEYTLDDIKHASKLIKRKGFKLGFRIMVGLPESTKLDDLNTAKELSKLRPKMVRISPVVVVKDTKLAEEYLSGDFEPISLNQAVERCKNIVYECNRKKIKSIIIGLPTIDSRIEDKKNQGIIAGPYDENFATMVEESIWYDSIVDKIKKVNAKVKQVQVKVNPQEYNNVIGIDEINLKKIKEVYNVDVKVVKDEEIQLGKSKIDILSNYED